MNLNDSRGFPSYNATENLSAHEPVYSSRSANASDQILYTYECATEFTEPDSLILMNASIDTNQLMHRGWCDLSALYLEWWLEKKASIARPVWKRVLLIVTQLISSNRWKNCIEREASIFLDFSTYAEPVSARSPDIWRQCNTFLEHGFSKI